MSEVVNALVAFAVIVFIFRWATSSNETPAERAAASALGFRPKPVTEEMVATVQGMFPDIPRDNVRYDLLRTGNVETTTNKILERGFLEAPPAGYYTVYPRNAAQTARNAALRPAEPVATTSATKPKPETLISRLHLQERVQQLDAGAATPLEPEAAPEAAASKAAWEDTPAKREASLRERKAQMVLAARQRMLAQQQKAATPGNSSSA